VSAATATTTRITTASITAHDPQRARPPRTASGAPRG
jgi:hypothetical protein